MTQGSHLQKGREGLPERQRDPQCNEEQESVQRATYRRGALQPPRGQDSIDNVVTV